MSADLTDAEREALACVATGHEPDLCDCHDGYRDVADRFCEYAQETFAVVARIKADAYAEGHAAGAAAVRESVEAALVEADELCPHEADAHPQGTCDMCDYAFAAVETVRAALATPTGSDA